MVSEVNNSNSGNTSPIWTLQGFSFPRSVCLASSSYAIQDLDTSALGSSSTVSADGATSNASMASSPLATPSITESPAMKLLRVQSGDISRNAIKAGAETSITTTATVDVDTNAEAPGVSIKPNTEFSSTVGEYTEMAKRSDASPEFATGQTDLYFSFPSFKDEGEDEKE